MKTTAENNQKWIHVNSKLPDYDQDVLLYFQRNNIEPVILIGKRSYTDHNGEHFGVSSCSPEINPSHWMPLPGKP